MTDETWAILTLVVSIAISSVLIFYVSTALAIVAGCTLFLVCNMLPMFVAQDNSIPLTEKQRLTDDDIKKIKKAFYLSVKQHNHVDYGYRHRMIFNELMGKIASGCKTADGSDCSKQDMNNLCERFKDSYNLFHAYFEKKIPNRKIFVPLMTVVTNEFSNIKGSLLY